MWVIGLSDKLQYFSEYSRKKLRRHYLNVDWVCGVRRQLQKCRWNCTFSKKRCCKGKRASHSPCLDQRTLELSPRSSEHKRRCCLTGRVVLRPPGLESAGVESEVVRTEGKGAANRTRRSENLSRQESAGLEPGGRPNRSILRKCLSCVFYHAVQPVMAQRLSNQMSSSH